MGYWLICLGTNLLPPECRPPRLRVPGVPDPKRIEALSYVAIGWRRRKGRLRHELIHVDDMTLPSDPGLRQDWLRAWHSQIERMKPAVVASFGARHFAPILRRMYLEDDHPYPAVLDIPPVDASRAAHRRNLHFDFAHVLSPPTLPNLPTFLQAAGLSAAQARASAGLTAHASLLRAVAALHLTLRFFTAVGELGVREQQETEGRFLQLIEGFGSDAAAVSRGLCDRSTPARPRPSHVRARAGRP